MIDANSTLEARRLEVLESYNILDTEPESEFDQLTKLASHVFNTPIATVTIVDKDRQWFKSSVGLNVNETPRDISFCTHAIELNEPLIVTDTAKSELFRCNPLVQGGPKLGFYAGVPIRNADNITLGTFCIMDTKPRDFTQRELEVLKTFANQALQLLEYRRERYKLRLQIHKSEQISNQLKAFSDHLAEAQRIAKIGSWELYIDDDVLNWSDQIYEIFGLEKTEFGANFDAFLELVHPEDLSPLLEAQSAAIQHHTNLNIEHRIIRKDGSIRYLHECAELLMDPVSNKQKLAGTVQDITERRLEELNRDALIKSEQRAVIRAENHMMYFRTLFENSPESYLALTTDDFRIIAASNAYLKATMSERENIVGKRVFDAFPPDPSLETSSVVEDLSASLIKIKKTKESDVMPIQLYPVKDEAGKYHHRYWSPVNIPIIDSDGEVSLIIHRVDDVTEFVLKEPATSGRPILNNSGIQSSSDTIIKGIEFQKIVEKIRSSEERFKLVARVTNDAIWDWNLTDNSLWWNIGIEKLFGFSISELESSIKSWTNRIHPEDLPRIETSIHKVIDSDQDVWGDEYRFLKRDGTYAYVEDRGLVVRNSEGKGVRMVGGMTDITVRKEYEKKLKEQAGLLNNARDAILVRDLNHHIRYWNNGAEKLYGYQANDVLGNSIESLLYPNDSARFLEATAETIKNGFWNGQIIQTCKDGRNITVDANWTLVLNEAGDPDAIFAINTDISEKLDLEHKLQHAQKLESIGQLTGGIAHDFNNLLTVIIGNSQILHEELELTPKLSALAEMVMMAGERGAELTQRLLAFARRQALEPRLIKVSKSIDGMKALLKRAIGEAVDIRIFNDDNLWDAFIDPAHFDSALMNLCINARDAMDGSGKITIEASNVILDADYATNNPEVVPGEYIVISISDTGHGMSKETLSKVFEPFFTTKAKGRGTGLGLSMVYGFTKQSGGHVKIYSELDIGTVVKLFIPRAADSETETSPIEVPEIIVKGNERILLVEDDELLRPHARRLLTELGYDVVEAANGVEALDVIRRDQQFDLLFTDVIMPGGMNGPQLAAETHKIIPNLPVLYTSGYTENAIVHHGKVDIGIDLLHKPYRKQNLAEKVRLTLIKASTPKDID